jgi:hypothetical protein
VKEILLLLPTSEDLVRLQDWWILALASLAACAPTGGPGPAPAPTPQLVSLSKTALAVGDVLSFEGLDLVDPEQGWVDVRFVGTFHPDDGTAPVSVDLTVPFESQDGVLRWERFGGYRVPFTPAGDQIGTFEGDVFAVNQYFDENVAPVEQPEGTWLHTSIVVLPSIVVLDNRAFGDTFIADCKEPSSTVLEALRYGFRVKAVGFDVGRWDFSLSPGLVIGENVQLDATELSYPADGAEFGLLTQWSPVPPNTDGYVASISASARGYDGITRTLSYPFMVRRPVEIFFYGETQIAELYPPVPVSGCVPGGPSSVMTEYSETTSETRTRQVERAMRRDWATTYGMQHEQSYGASEEEGFSETRTSSVTTADTAMRGGSTMTTDLFSSTDGRTSATTLTFVDTNSEQVGVEVGREDYRGNTVMFGVEGRASGEIGVPLVANGEVEVGASSSYGRQWGSRDSRATSAGRGRQASQGVEGMEGTMTSTTRARTYANQDSWGLSQTYEEQNGFNTTRAIERTRSFGEALTTSQSVSQSIGTTETEILSVSTTQSESLRTAAWVWAGQYGVWYRQTSRLTSVGAVVAYDLCGNGTEVGRVSLDDWAWAPDLAIGDMCPPPTNLPAPECRIPPC